MRYAIVRGLSNGAFGLVTYILVKGIYLISASAPGSAYNEGHAIRMGLIAMMAVALGLSLRDFGIDCKN